MSKILTFLKVILILHFQAKQRTDLSHEQRTDLNHEQKRDLNQEQLDSTMAIGIHEYMVNKQ